MVDSDWPAESYVGNWYVAVIDGVKKPRHGFLLGPYCTAFEAQSMVNTAVKLADEVDPRAWFYTYAICNLPPHITKRGVLMDMLEKQQATYEQPTLPMIA